MYFLLPSNKFFRGQVYIGLVVSTALFLILSQTIFTLVISVFDLVSFTRARTTATQLANEKSEIIKNLKYADIGTIGGIPNGIIESTEITIRSGLNYTINTVVIYKDDPFDGLAPADLNASDYKHIEVSVTWGGITSAKSSPVILATDISPPSTLILTGGVLNVNVSDSQGSGIHQAQVTIVADSVVPPVNTTLTTDINGLVTLPGALPCSECYSISVTKAGMSTDKTYDASEVTNPSKPHASVADGQVTETSFAIDLTGTLNIISTNDRSSGFTTLPNQSFVLRGEKLIGTDAFGVPVYKYDETNITDGSGSLILSDFEWDNYNIIIPDGGVYDVTGTNPLLPITLLPGQTVDIAFSSALSSNHRLLSIFTDSSDIPLASISATITDGGAVFDLPTGESTDPDYGQAFFSSLAETTYTIAATGSGFLDFNDSVVVTGYVIEKIIMQPE